MLVRTFVAVAVVLGLGSSFAMAQTRAFTYQGKLDVMGVPAQGTFNFGFTLYSTESGPGVIGAQTIHGVVVNDGLFTVTLNLNNELGSNAFNGEDRWLEVTANGVVLTPRQRLTTAPTAAWSLGPWIPGNGHVTFPNRAALGTAAGSTPTARLLIEDGTNIPAPPSLTSYVPFKITDGTRGILADGNQIESVGDSLFLNARQSAGGNPGNNIVLVNGGGNVGIGTASPTNRLSVAGNANISGDLSVGGDADFTGGSLLGAAGIYGITSLRLGVGDGSTATLILTDVGTLGVGATYGFTTRFNVRSDFVNTIIFNVEDFTGNSFFQVQQDQDVIVDGDFFVSGTKNFLIDHPLHPTTHDLVHNAVESPGYHTQYHGNVTLGDDGSAWVTLPDYFDALNIDPAYQLTCVGGQAAVYVAEEVRGNRFRIAGGTPGLKVSWLVHATRNDPYAREHPYRAVREKEDRPLDDAGVQARGASVGR